MFIVDSYFRTAIAITPDGPHFYLFIYMSLLNMLIIKGPVSIEELMVDQASRTENNKTSQ
jgi:hypothetical protein